MIHLSHEIENGLQDEIQRQQREAQFTDSDNDLLTPELWTEPTYEPVETEFFPNTLNLAATARW